MEILIKYAKLYINLDVFKWVSDSDGCSRKKTRKNENLDRLNQIDSF